MEQLPQQLNPLSEIAEVFLAQRLSIEGISLDNPDVQYLAIYLTEENIPALEMTLDEEALQEVFTEEEGLALIAQTLREIVGIFEAPIEETPYERIPEIQTALAITQTPEQGREVEISLQSLLEPFRETAQERVRAFREAGNEVNNEEQYIRDFILIGSKEQLLANYRREIQAETPWYSAEGYESLQTYIIATETRVSRENPVFYRYILDNQSPTPPILRAAPITDIQREALVWTLTGNPETRVWSDWDFLTVGDQRIRLRPNGTIESHITGGNERGNISLEVESPSLLPVLRQQTELERIDREIAQLDIFIEAKIEKQQLLEEELRELEVEDPENVNISKIRDALNTLIETIQQSREQKEVLVQRREVVAWALARTQLEYRRIMALRNARTRQTLRFLESIWLNQLPDNLLESIIEQINKNPSIRWLAGIHTDINLSEGELGFNFDYNPLVQSSLERTAFAELINRLISGNPEEPLNIEAVRLNNAAAIPDRNVFQQYLLDRGILGVWALATMMANLEASYQELDLPNIDTLDTGVDIRYPRVTQDTVVLELGEYRVVKKAASQSLSIYRGNEAIVWNQKEGRFSQSLENILRGWGRYPEREKEGLAPYEL